MKIKKISITGDFRYLWLKTVVDVDLNQHCAKCLIGEYDNRISEAKKKAEVLDMELEDQVYYLCGVANPFVWSNNFHLAFRPLDGSSIIYSTNGITIEIEGAERLPISVDHIDTTHPKAKFKTYHTCRNYQFAHWFYKNIREC